MSNKALTWAFELSLENVGAKFVLVALADHAGDHKGENWTCYPSVERLMEFTSQSSATVRRHLAWLLKERWITRKPTPGREREDGMFTYTLHRDRAADVDPQADQPVRKMSTGAGDDVCSKSIAPPLNLSTTSAQNEHSPCTPYIAEPPLNPHEPSACVALREASEQVFSRVVKAWSAAAPERCSRVKAWPKWQEACDGRDPADLERAALRYLAEAGEVKRKLTKALDRWLGEAWFENWLPGAAPAPGVPAERAVWAGDPGVRAAIVALTGDAWAVSYIDPSGWDQEVRAIIPLNSFAGDRIRDRLRRHLEGLDIRIAERKAQ